MERITLSFNIADRKLGYDEADTFRRQLASVLDAALQPAQAGKWVGGMHTKDAIEIFLMVDDYDRALPLIESALKDHLLYSSMKVTRRS
jgi:hypothetical protein